MRRILLAIVVAALAALGAAACGSPSIGPTPPPGGGNGGGGGDVTPPPNNVPVIDSIAVQGTRPRQPPNFADLGEAIAVSAKVHDDETAVDQLQFTWTATAGSFSGTGANVFWLAPAQAPATTLATITLTVLEKFGNPGAPLLFEQSVSKAVSVSLHDSVKEVGAMARQFLLDFSDTNIKDANYIMRNFSSAACPDPGSVQDEREDVIRNYTEYKMLDFRIDQPAVTVNFGATCSSGAKGDACAVVGVFWDSVQLSTSIRQPNAGQDIVAATYSPKDTRWWLCASRYEGRNLITGARISR